MSSEVEQLAEPGAQELLLSDQPLRLAYLGRDGSPRVVPVGFLWKQQRLFVCTATSAPKVAAIKARPKVAMTIDVGSSPSDSKQLLVRGTAAIDIVDGVAPEYIEAAAKTESGKELEEFEERARAVFEQQARISIAPAWVRFYDFGAGQLPPFLSRLAGEARG